MADGAEKLLLQCGFKLPKSTTNIVHDETVEIIKCTYSNSRFIFFSADVLFIMN